MHPLAYLLALQTKALGRRLRRAVGTVKGALLVLFGLGIVALWLLPAFLDSSAPGAPKPPDPERLRAIAPVALLVVCLGNVIMSGGERAISFSPAEVDFLFPGPFTRRAILTYKLARSLAGITFSSLVLSAAFLRYAGGWGQAALALFLTLLFLQLLSMSVALLAQSAGERAYTTGRKLVLVGVIGAIAVAIGPALAKVPKWDVPTIAGLLRSSRVGAALLYPLEAFGNLFTAKAWWPDALRNAGLAAAIDAALLLLVLRLDANYLESAAAKSTALHERMQRMRHGGIMTAGKVRARFTLPRPPLLGGAGPILWRQATAAVRSSPRMLLMLLLIGAAAPAVFSGHAEVDPTGATISALLWATLMLIAWLRFDFRGDLERMDHLKSLPASRLAVAVGQLATPVLVLSTVHLLVLAGVIIATGHPTPGLILAACLCVPFNTLMVAIENTMFLYYPVRATLGAGDFQGMGRQMLQLTAKLLLLLVAAAVTLAAWWVTAAVTRSPLLAHAAAVVVAAGLALATVFWTAAAFATYDVSGQVET